ncbi:UNVERIFIED_CONTAM: hypothetical protein Sindi_1239300 [Sesamum indicum]
MASSSHGGGSSSHPNPNHSGANLLSPVVEHEALFDEYVQGNISLITSTHPRSQRHLDPGRETPSRFQKHHDGAPFGGPSFVEKRKHQHHHHNGDTLEPVFWHN